MKPNAVQHLLLATSLVCSTLLVGCGSDKPTAPLTPISFQNRNGLTNNATTTAPTPVPPPVATASSPAKSAATPSSATTRPIAQAPVIPTQPSATHNSPTQSPTLNPLIRPGASLGQYQTLGGIVSEVNGNPIYANKVLRQLEPELAARAADMDEKQFRSFAQQEIQKKIAGLQRDELVFGAADRSLETEDRKFAEFLTMQWRTQQITEAGGSAELAYRKAQAEGNDFDDLVFDRYRRYMTEVFYRKKVVPRIQITADDLRTYYNMNLAREFTHQDEVTFRLIKVDTRKFISKAAARQRAEELLAQAKAADFAELARTANDDPRLARSGGEEAPIQRGAYRLEKVEATLWDTPVGQLTPIVEDTGGFYIAKIESRKQGRTLPFEDREVQDTIQRTLWARQFRALTDAIEQSLRRNSMVRETPEMTKIALEMAMQNYTIWSKANPQLQ